MRDDVLKWNIKNGYTTHKTADRYTVSLDGSAKARGLSFKDAIRVGTDLSVKIGHINASERVKITSSGRYTDPEPWDFRGQHAVYDNPELSGAPIDFIDHRDA